MPQSVVSTVPLVKDNLQRQLNARPGLAGVTVFWGYPSAQPPREMIILGNVRQHRETAAALGHQRRDERYTIPVRIVVQASGTDLPTASKRAEQIAEEICAQLKTDPTVNQCGVQWAVVEAQQTLDNMTSTQMAPEVLMNIGCMARLG